MEIAWLANGRLVRRDADGRTHEHTSAFAEQVADRSRSIQRRNAWKTQGRGARFAAWGAPMDEDLPSFVEQARAVALSRGREPGELLFALQTGSVSALLALAGGGGGGGGGDEGGDGGGTGDDERGRHELRLYHTADLRLGELAMEPDQDRIAVSVAYPSGVVNLGLLSRDGSHLVDVTEGDSIDAAPRWAGPGRLVYQSAGIGRDDNGMYGGRAPFAVCGLDVRSGALETLAEDPDHDLMSPARDPSGALYYVRRPFVGPDAGPSLGQLALDVLLSPLRLARAVLSWLDFFTIRYTGKPMISPGGVKRGPDEKSLFLLGNVVDVEQARLESLKAGDETPALVPQSWELVRERRGGSEVIARGVLAFDVGPDGTVLYTNGRGVFVLDGDRPRLVAEGERIEAVLAV